MSIEIVVEQVRGTLYTSALPSIKAHITVERHEADASELLTPSLAYANSFLALRRLRKILLIGERVSKYCPIYIQTLVVQRAVSGRHSTIESEEI